MGVAKDIDRLSQQWKEKHQVLLAIQEVLDGPAWPMDKLAEITEIMKRYNVKGT